MTDQGLRPAAWGRGRWVMLALIVVAVSVIVVVVIRGGTNGDEVAAEPEPTVSSTQDQEGATADSGSRTTGTDTASAGSEQVDSTASPDVADSSPDQTTASPTAAALADGEAMTEIQDALDFQADALADGGSGPSEDAPDWSAIAGGVYRAVLEDQAEEFESMGLFREGAAVVLSAEVVDEDPSADPAWIEVEACVDSSDVNVFDENGALVHDGSATERTAMVFTLEFSDGRWLIVQDGFAEPLDC